MNQICTSTELHDEIVHVSTGLMLACTVDQQANDSLQKVLTDSIFADNVHLMPILEDVWFLFLR